MGKVLSGELSCLVTGLVSSNNSKLDCQLCLTVYDFEKKIVIHFLNISSFSDEDFDSEEEEEYNEPRIPVQGI